MRVGWTYLQVVFLDHVFQSLDGVWHASVRGPECVKTKRACYALVPYQNVRACTSFTYVCLTTYLPHNYFHCALSIQFEYCQEMCAVALLIYSTGCRNTEGGLFQHHGHSSQQAVLASLCRQCSNIYTYFCLSTSFHKRDSASAVAPGGSPCIFLLCIMQRVVML